MMLPFLLLIKKLKKIKEIQQFELSYNITINYPILGLNRFIFKMEMQRVTLSDNEFTFSLIIL